MRYSRLAACVDSANVVCLRSSPPGRLMVPEHQVTCCRGRLGGSDASGRRCLFKKFSFGSVKALACHLTRPQAYVSVALCAAGSQALRQLSSPGKSGSMFLLSGEQPRERNRRAWAVRPCSCTHACMHACRHWNGGVVLPLACCAWCAQCEVKGALNRCCTDGWPLSTSRCILTPVAVAVCLT
jgi:hypothetical protein